MGGTDYLIAMIMIIIKEETTADIGFVHKINVLAFGRPDEAILVNKLRKRCSEILSLIAIQDDKVVGHILFSPVTIKSGDSQVVGMGLGPMAVLPKYQNQGVGSTLVRYGIAWIKQRGCGFVVVLGHPKYYPRFGFEPARQHGVHCEWDVPDEAFMIQVFRKAEVPGQAIYQPEFSDLI